MSENELITVQDVKSRKSLTSDNPTPPLDLHHLSAFQLFKCQITATSGIEWRNGKEILAEGGEVGVASCNAKEKHANVIMLTIEVCCGVHSI